MVSIACSGCEAESVLRYRIRVSNVANPSPFRVKPAPDSDAGKSVEPLMKYTMRNAVEIIVQERDTTSEAAGEVDGCTPII